MQTNYHTEQGDEIHLSNYWRILKRHKWIVITVFVVTVMIVTIASILMTPVYRSTAVLFIDQETSNVVTISENNLALGAQNYARQGF